MDSQIKKYTLNGKSVWRGNLYKVKGCMQANPIHFYIRPLNVNDAKAMGKLSQTIYQNLRTGEECFIHKHTAQYYYEVFKNPDIHYIGVFAGHKLIGMSSMKICHNKDEIEKELPNSKYNFFNPSRASKEILVASFGADSVLPEFRGNGLNTIMINYRLQEAEKLGCTDCTSIVDRNNRWNMLPYLSCNFNLFGTAVDPSDMGKISQLHRPIGRQMVLTKTKPSVSVHYDSLDCIDSLLNKGYIGIGFDKEEANVIFSHSSEYQDNFIIGTFYRKRAGRF